MKPEDMNTKFQKIGVQFGKRREHEGVCENNYRIGYYSFRNFKTFNILKVI